MAAGYRHFQECIKHLQRQLPVPPQTGRQPSRRGLESSYYQKSLKRTDNNDKYKNRTGKRMKGIAQGVLQASNVYSCFTKQERNVIEWQRFLFHDNSSKTDTKFLLMNAHNFIFFLKNITLVVYSLIEVIFFFEEACVQLLYKGFSLCVFAYVVERK